MAWNLVIAGGIILLDFAYHRLFDDDNRPKPPREVSIPRVDEGAMVPMIFGKCRVLQPLLVFVQTPAIVDTEDQFPAAAAHFPITYIANMMLILGVGFKDGRQRIHRMYAGDKEFDQASFGAGIGTDHLEDQTGEGWTVSPEQSTRLSLGDFSETGCHGGLLEFHSGADDQELVGSYPDTTHAGIEMLTETGDGNQVANYRGYMMAFLWNSIGFTQWMIGATPQVAAYSFEASSYPSESNSFDSPTIGEDCNPVDALKRLLVGRFGELGLSTDLIDYETWQAAAATVNLEGNGYSRCFDQAGDAEAKINEILEQIDGMFYTEPTTGRICLALIRPVADPNTMPRINEANCDRLENQSAGSRSNLISRIRVVFNDRSLRYGENSVTVPNQAALQGADAVVNELVLNYPGVSNAALAKKIGEREMSARSRPIFRCRAWVDRSLLRLTPGQSVVLTWPKSHISNMICIVGAISRGEKASNYLAVELLQDFHYLHRGSLLGAGGTFGAPPSVIG